MNRPLFGRALAEVSTDTLKALLRRVHSGEIRAPLQVAELACFGFQAVTEEVLGSMRGLDAAGVRAVLVAVLAERAAAEDRAQSAPPRR